MELSYGVIVAGLVLGGCGGESAVPPFARGTPDSGVATKTPPEGTTVPEGTDAGNVASPETDGGKPSAPSFSASQVHAAEAKCAAEHGAALAPVTWGDFRRLLVDSWLVCPVGTKVSSVFGVAITFSANGTWHHWLSDGKGGLRFAQGVVDQGTYYFPTGYDNDAYSNTDSVRNYPWVNIAAASHVESPDGLFTGMITFEGTPRRMFATQMYDTESIELWLVPLQ